MDGTKDVEIDLTALMGEELPVTPKELLGAKFKGKVFGGYNRAEVDRFLEKTAASFEAVVGKLAEVQADNDDMRGQATAARELQVSLRAMLGRAEQLNTETLANAKREADALVAEARAIKGKAELEARELPTALRQEIDALKAARNRLRTDIMSVVDTHAALVENLPSAEEELDIRIPSADFSPDSETSCNTPFVIEGEPWKDGDEETQE
jgi:DivIVA domain-containing protein